MTMRQSIRKALSATCHYDFLTLNGAIRPPTCHDAALRNRVKAHLQANGWSYRDAAPAVGLGAKGGYATINGVLNGSQFSHPLIERLLALPKRNNPNPRSGKFNTKEVA